MDRKRRLRWRLVLGTGAEGALGSCLDGQWGRCEQALGYLYDRDQGCRRSPDRVLTLGRRQLTANPQAFAWEKLRAPVLAEDFGEIRGRLEGPAVVFHPTCVVFERDGKRSAVQPWVDRFKGRHEIDSSRLDLSCLESSAGEPPRVERYPAELLEALGELYRLGLRRADEPLVRQWRDLARQGEAVGFTRLAAPVARLARRLERKLDDTRWDWRPAARAALEVSLLGTLAQDLAS